MKKFILAVFFCFYGITMNAQSCDEEDLSTEGLYHYKKALEYSKKIEAGTIEKALAEWERLIQTDSLWCDEVYRRSGLLCEYLYTNKKPTGQKQYLEKAVLYFSTYLAFNPDDRDVINKLSILESKLDIGKNSINDSIKIEMVYVEGMLNKDTTDCTHSFYIGKYEVTQKQWEAVMGSNPSHFKGQKLPIENISVVDVSLFINELNRITGNKYRLPTEEEWKYAAHGGKARDNFAYSGGHASDKVGWTKNNSFNMTHPVGEKEPNSLGIYDMTGNVSEIFFKSKKNNYREDIYEYVTIGGDYKSSPSNIDWIGNNYNKSDCNGIRLVLPVNEYSDEEQRWDMMIINHKQEEAQRHEEAQQKKDRRDSYFPIIRMDKVWSDINIGYDFKEGELFLNATVSPGPVYASALLTDKDTSFFSAGLKLRIINRFDLLLGASYSPQEKLWGCDVGLHYYFNNNIDFSGGTMFFKDNRIIPHAKISFYGLSLGAMQYNNHTVPTFGMRIDKNLWDFNITSVYGYDFADESHLLGISGFIGPIYLGAHYQTDKSYHFSLGGISTIFGSKHIGFHSALAYSSTNKFGLDMGFTFSLEEKVQFGNASVGALMYRNKIIPTIGLGGGVGFGTLGLAGLIAGAIWGGYTLYVKVLNH